MRLAIVLFAVLVIASATTCDKCAFTDSRNLAQSTCTANGKHRLACPGSSQITNGQDSFDQIVCADAQWYGLNCDGKVVVLNATVAVSCPFTCASTCASEGSSDPSLSPTTACHDGKEMKTCGSGELNIETSSGPVSFSKAVCLGGDQWLGFSCDGSLQKFNGSLKASCPPAVCDPAPFTTVFQPTPILAVTESDGVYSCPANLAMVRNDTIEGPMTIASATCENGQFRTNSTLTVSQIGCFACDMQDGEVDTWGGGGENRIKALLKNCVLTCPAGFKLQRYLNVNQRKYVTQLVRRLRGGGGTWYEEETGEFGNWTFECHPI